jgi:uncharacterized protein YcfJ
LTPVRESRAFFLGEVHVFKRMSSYVVLLALSLTGTASAQSPGWQPETPESIIAADEARAAKARTETPEPIAVENETSLPYTLIAESEKSLPVSPAIRNLVGAATRSTRCRTLTPEIARRARKASVPTNVAIDIDGMIREVLDIEERWHRGEITADQRDLEQGKAVAGAVGAYGGEVVGRYIGAALDTAVGGPAGTKVGEVAGGYAGAKLGDAGMRHVAGSCEEQTREIVKTVRSALDGNGATIYKVYKVVTYDPFAEMTNGWVRMPLVVW